MLIPAEEQIHSRETREWLAAFQSDPSLALAQVPNRVFAYLRDQGLLTSELTLTPQGVNLAAS